PRRRLSGVVCPRSSLSSYRFRASTLLGLLLLLAIHLGAAVDRGVRLGLGAGGCGLFRSARQVFPRCPRTSIPRCPSRRVLRDARMKGRSERPEAALHPRSVPGLALA